MKFKVGDKIRMVKKYDAAKEGTIGEVVGFDKESDLYAVKFNTRDINDSGHDCGGILKAWDGLWIPEDHMEFIRGSSVSPIMRFESQQQLEESLAEWQSRLLLSDWLIMVKLVNPEELVKDGKQAGGFNNHVDTLMSSEISIADGEFPDSITKICAE